MFHVPGQWASGTVKSDRSDGEENIPQVARLLGLRNQVQPEDVTLRFDQPISTESAERVRRQMLHFACSRGLEPALDTPSHVLGLTMQPLTGNTNRTSLSIPQPGDNTRTHNHHNHLNRDSVPYEEYLRQGEGMAVGRRREDGGRMAGDGRERGTRPKKRHKAGFEFRT